MTGAAPTPDPPGPPTAPPTVTLTEPAHPPSRRAPWRWAAGAAVWWVLAAIAQIVWALLRPGESWLHAGVAAVTVVAAVVSVAVVPVWRYRVHRWDISDRPGAQAVYTRSGWLTQERRIAPISRVQTVDTFRGPLDQLFGLSNVTVTTASAAGAVHIVALDRAVADEVVARLTDIAALGEQDAT